MIFLAIGKFFGGIWAMVPAPIRRALAWLAAAALAVLLAFGMGKREGRLGTAHKAAKDAAKRSEAGRKAAGKAKAQIDAGKTPEDVARNNDGKWR